ncbi:MAG: thioredoxin family protein, partial [Ilumatobacter sp.]|nr:thioredoxin family protein [Ilumatobacter sp.]
MTGNADTAPAPTLPDGIVIIVKEECETCQTVVPVLQQLHAATELTVYTQDNASFPSAPTAAHDADLAVSWHHEIETVPTVIVVRNGVEVERTVGWMRPEWERLTGVDGLGEGLPVMRPGCGSMSVDP